MEAAAAARIGSVPAMTQAAAQTRKQWRAVPAHRNEVQQGREPVDVDFCSITIDRNMDSELLQQQLHDIVRQREELHHQEIELRAQMMARSEIMEIRNDLKAQLNERVNAASKLQEQLHEKKQSIHDLERKLEEKERELHATKLDNEAAWAKEGLLREQNKELATFRRERDHSEAERAQYIQQLHDLQEHIQDKERRLLELQEQNRLAQEAITYKDEQLNEAQTWIARVQEIDALQSSALQNQLREYTEHYNQLWLGCQRQFAEMERHHMHTVQQLQLELADARKKSGTYVDESRLANSSSLDENQFGRSNGNQIDMSTSKANTGTLNSEDVSSFSSTVNPSSQVDHVPSIPIGPSSLLGMPPFLPSGQVTGMHPFVLQQSGVPHSMPPQVPLSHVGNFHSVPAMSSLQQWQNQQTPSESSQITKQPEPPSSQNEQNWMSSDAKYNYETSINGQPFHQDYLDVQIRQGLESEPVISSSPEEVEVLESINNTYLVPQTDQSLQQVSSQFTDSLRLESLEKTSEPKDVQTLIDHGMEEEVLMPEEPNSATHSSKSDTAAYSVNLNEIATNNIPSTCLPEPVVSSGHTSSPSVVRTLEAALQDERSLLACMVRTIPAGGKIRISSTLPNRLGKMLAPLHWSDYKKKYGKLDDFVAAHTELFLVEGDFIWLREGAQEMIAATAAAAKVAAAAAAAAPYSASLPSVAVTPVSQTHRMKKNQRLNGVTGGVSNVKILSKIKDMNGPESTLGHSSVRLNGGNGAVLDRSMANGRPNSNVVGGQHGMTTDPAYAFNRI